jgi:8-oxo-dGTP pyrophosphatase MutT (NUDIX family)
VSLHADAVRTLDAWIAPDPAQESMRLRFLEHLLDHADGLSRSCAPEHITASALIVSPERGEVLLVLHAKAGRWLQTGGHCEPGDPTLAAAALREATEESGIAGLTLTMMPVRLDRHPAPCRRGVVEKHLDVQYLAIAPPGARPTRSSESLDLAWFPFDALPSPSDVQHLVSYASANSAPEAWVTPSRKPRARSARG